MALTLCVHSKLFHVTCETKTEAKAKILAKLKEEKAEVLQKENPMGEMVPFVNYDFQTLKRNEGQESDVLSDVMD